MIPRQEEALRHFFEADRALESQGLEPERFRLRFTGESPAGEIEHRCWDPDWAVPTNLTIDELGELELLQVDPHYNKSRTFAFSAHGRSVAVEMFAPAEVTAPAPDPANPRDPRKVAVMYGRDIEATRWMRGWLRKLDLDPLEWSDLVDSTGKGAPYNGEAVEAAFREAQAVVVLFTPDEIGLLHPELVDETGSSSDDGAQPRLNVILEAGMALQSHPDKTILVQIGLTREISNLAGRNTVQLTGDFKELNNLARRLERAGCQVNKSGDEWSETDELERLTAMRRMAGTDPADLVPARPGGIAVVKPADGAYRVIRTIGVRIELREHDGKGWGAWTQVGSVLDEEPVGIASSSSGPGHIEVFALLRRGEVVHNWWKDGSWQREFDSLGTPFREQPVNRIAAGSNGEGHQEVFVEAASGEIAHRWWEERWRRLKKTPLGDGWRRL